MGRLPWVILVVLKWNSLVYIYFLFFSTVLSTSLGNSLMGRNWDLSDLPEGCRAHCQGSYVKFQGCWRAAQQATARKWATVTVSVMIWPKPWWRALLHCILEQAGICLCWKNLKKKPQKQMFHVQVLPPCFLPPCLQSLSVWRTTPCLYISVCMILRSN